MRLYLPCVASFTKLLVRCALGFLIVVDSSTATKALCVSKNFSTNVTPFLVLNASTLIISIFNLSVTSNNLVNSAFAFLVGAGFQTPTCRRTWSGI